MNTNFGEAFEGAFMRPQVYFGGYFEIDTTCGTELVPVDVVGRTMNADVSIFANYLEGEPLDQEAMVERRDGWLARLSAPGYMDCTDWTAHVSRSEAEQYLIDTFGGEQ